jgi:hypothetical protein
MGIIAGITAAVLILLLMLIYWFACYQIDKTTYLYKGNSYYYIGRCLMKTESGMWVSAIIYADRYNKCQYVREETDFMTKFISLKQWREQNKKCKFVDKSK